MSYLSVFGLIVIPLFDHQPQVSPLSVYVRYHHCDPVFDFLWNHFDHVMKIQFTPNLWMSLDFVLI
jgi:hypothetical protein